MACFPETSAAKITRILGTTAIVRNAWAKREYKLYVTRGQGFGVLTSDSILGAIALYEGFSEDKDFSQFNRNQALLFCDWLADTPCNTGRPRSVRTQINILWHLKQFFSFLHSLPEYRNKYPKTDADYFRLSRNICRAANSRRGRRGRRAKPDFDTIVEVIKSLPKDDPQHGRERFCLELLILFGPRSDTAIYAKIQDIDRKRKRLKADILQGGKSKNGHILSIKAFDRIPWIWDDFLEYIDKILIEASGFSEDDPLIPSLTALYQPRENTRRTKGIRSNTTLNAILKSAFLHSGIKTYTVHQLRAMRITEGLNSCTTFAQKKAFSQNNGHRHLATTLEYGYLPPEREEQQLQKINFQLDLDKLLDRDAIISMGDSERLKLLLTLSQSCQGE